MAEGELTVDDYRLINCIATGNTSQIWEVIDAASQAHFAMKLLLPEAFLDPEQKKVIKHEANVAKVLEHPNLVKFHKLVANKEHAYIVMEYFRAPNLKSQILSDHIGLQVRIRKLIEQVALALSFMHEKGWIHKDIKPENILLNKGSELRLIDFSLSVKNATGFAKMLAGKPKVVQGTRTYIAPETIKREAATPQTDIYSLGVTLYEVLAGSPPFKGSSPNDLLKKHLAAKPAPPSAFNPNVAPEMDRFVLKMLAKKPADRHKSMNELLAEFRTVKVFTEDVQELADQTFAKSEKDRKDVSVSLGVRLDSRGDHERTNDRAAGLASAAAPAAAASPVPASPPGIPLPPTAAPQQQRPAPAPPAPRPGMPPGMPGNPPPGAMRPQPAPMQPAAVANPGQTRGPMPQQQPGMPPPAAGRPGAPGPQYSGAPQPYPQQPWGYPPPGPPQPGQPMPAGQQRAPQPGQPFGAPPAPGGGAGRPSYQVRQPGPAPQQAPQQPGQPMPQRQPPAGGQPAPGQQPPRPAPRPVAPPPRPQPEPDDLPTMDELPPVI